MQNQLYHIQTSQLAPARRLPHRELRRGPLPSHHDACPLQPGGWLTLSTHIYTYRHIIYTCLHIYTADGAAARHQAVSAPEPGGGGPRARPLVHGAGRGPAVRPGRRGGGGGPGRVQPRRGGRHHRAQLPQLPGHQDPRHRHHHQPLQVRLLSVINKSLFTTN